MSPSAELCQENRKRRKGVSCACESPKLDIPSLLEALGNPAAVLSPEFQILAANQAYRDRFNHGERVCGRKCFEVSHGLAIPCSEAGASCPLTRAAESGERARALHVHHTCQGEEQEMVSIHPLFNLDSEVNAFLEILSPSRIAKTRPRKGNGLVGRSEAFNRMLDLIARAAPAQTTVLLLGESGTGKEDAAADVPRRGSR